MKKYSVLYLLTTVLCLASGCAGANSISKIIAAAAKDPAAVHVEFSGWGASIKYDRNNASAAQTAAAVTLTPITTIKVEPAK